MRELDLLSDATKTPQLIKKSIKISLISLIRMALSRFHPYVFWVIISILFVYNVYETATNRTSNDHTLEYRDLIKVQKSMVSYFFEQPG